MIRLKSLGQYYWPYYPQYQYPRQPMPSYPQPEKRPQPQQPTDIKTILGLGLPALGFIFVPKILGTVCSIGGCLALAEYLKKLGGQKLG